MATERASKKQFNAAITPDDNEVRLRVYYGNAQTGVTDLELDEVDIHGQYNLFILGPGKDVVGKKAVIYSTVLDIRKEHNFTSCNYIVYQGNDEVTFINGFKVSADGNEVKYADTINFV